jgi:hypothetical protein
MYPKEVLPAIAFLISKKRKESRAREVGGTRNKGAKIRASPMGGM